MINISSEMLLTFNNVWYKVLLFSIYKLKSIQGNYIYYGVVQWLRVTWLITSFVYVNMGFAYVNRVATSI